MIFGKLACTNWDEWQYRVHGQYLWKIDVNEKKQTYEELAGTSSRSSTERKLRYVILKSYHTLSRLLSALKPFHDCMLLPSFRKICILRIGNLRWDSADDRFGSVLKHSDRRRNVNEYSTTNKASKTPALYTPPNNNDLSPINGGRHNHVFPAYWTCTWGNHCRPECSGKCQPRSQNESISHAKCI